MKRALFVFAAGCLAVGPAPALQVEGNTIIFSEEEMVKCIEEGGCFVITRMQMGAAMQEVFKAARLECGNRI
jgi:hypothetical protein